MKYNYSIAERNRIVEENLHRIDRTIRRNRALIRAAHLDRDDVYQQLAIRLIRCVDTYDPSKGPLKKRIYAQLKYELLNCKEVRRLTGITNAPKDFRRGNVISINAIREDSGLYRDYLAV